MPFFVYPCLYESKHGLFACDEIFLACNVNALVIYYIFICKKFNYRLKHANRIVKFLGADNAYIYF